MSEQDQGNKTTQIMYQMATEPIFGMDSSLKQPENVTWEIGSLRDDEVDETQVEPQNQIENPLIQPEQEKEIQDLPAEKEEQETLADFDSDDEKEKVKKKNRTSEKKRIADLTRQLKQAQSVAHDVLNRNQYLEKKLSEKQKQSLEQEENLLTSQKERVKKYLTDAIEEGDPQKIAEANDLLSQYNAHLALIEENKRNQKSNITPEYKVPQSYNNQEQYQNDPSHYQEFNENAQDWLEKNAWANPYSPDFDQDLHTEADEFSIKLARRYKISGKGDEIGSSEFFDEISSYMRDHYERSYEQPLEKRQPLKGKIQMKADNTKVAPVNRSSSPAEPPRTSRDIILSQDQKEAAHALKGIIRDPKTGQKILDNETLEKIYKKNLMRG